MKKHILTLTLAFITTFTVPTLSHAVSGSIELLRVVDSILSTTEKLTFTPSETPYLYVKLSRPGKSNVSSFWKAPYGTSFLAQDNGTAGERWLSLANWSSVVSPGNWEINANVFFPNGDTDTATANFTVTPEPLSTSLFLLGGVPVAAHLYRRKKKQLA